MKHISHKGYIYVPIEYIKEIARLREIIRKQRWIIVDKLLKFILKFTHYEKDKKIFRKQR